MNIKEARARLESVLALEGVRAALAFLNSLTPHRFTAMYLFDQEMLRNSGFYDRENPDAEPPPDIPVASSYCVFVRSGCCSFSFGDSLSDERVTGHPKQRQVRAYCGVPLVDEAGRMFGTICHFDFQPMPISDANVDLMEAVAPLLARMSHAGLAVV